VAGSEGKEEKDREKTIWKIKEGGKDGKWGGI